MIKQVKKRDGSVTLFDANRIIDAVAKAFISTSEITAKEISTMASAIQVIATNAIVDKFNILGVKYPSYCLYRFSHIDRFWIPYYLRNSTFE